ncbi:MAG: hypothetical protein QNI84_04425 [Henriciella sp.]|nr:hypothetical protein [Henriciella sp.]
MKRQDTVSRPNPKALLLSALIFVIGPVGVVLIVRWLTSIG